jgi:ketosteroid isomerase-like protein
MSQENLEIVLGIARASSEGDVDYVIRHTTEEFVMFVARSSVEGPYVGHNGIRQWFADNRENFDVYRLHLDDVREIGEDQVLALGTVHVRGRGGGVETDVPFAGVTTFRDGRASRFEDYRERSLALKAMGLED